MDIDVVKTTNENITTALRNGMTLKQISDRVPAITAKQLKLTVSEFHTKLNELSDYTIDVMVMLIVNSFSDEEIDKIKQHQL
jgi:hypothetical protein